MLPTPPSEDTVGSIRLDPPGPFVAGSRHTLRLTYTAGASGVEEGGALRIYPPHQGHTYWELGKVTAEASRVGVACEVETFNDRPYTFHHSNPPWIRVTVYGGPLREGDTVTITLGEHGGYSRGYFRLARVAQHAWCDYKFDCYVDVLGNGERPLEYHRPDAFVRIPDEPHVEIVADRPASVFVTAKAPGQAGADEFEIVASVRDEFGNLADYEGSLKVECTDPDATLPEAIGVNEGVGMCDVHPARRPEGAVRIEGCRLSAETARVTLYDPKQQIIGTSNIAAPGFAGEGLEVYFGDLHVMTGKGLSGQMMLGDTDYAYQWARDVEGLDFSVVTNHGIGEKWEQDLEVDNAFNEPGRFVTIPAMERYAVTGHKNLYFRSSDVPALPKCSVEEIFEWLAQLDVPGMAISHHPNVHSETSRYHAWGPQDFSTTDPRFERLVEVCQCRGSMEVEDVGGAVSLGELGSSVQSALAMGLRLGFVGGTDNHRAQPGSKRSNLGGLVAEEIINGGYTAVFAPELTREALFDALWDRRCYATTSRRILLDVAMGEHPMGSDLSDDDAAAFADERSITIRAIAHGEIDRIEVVRNNETVESVEVGGDRESLTYTDPTPLAEVPSVSEQAPDMVFYYVRVIEADGNLAWSSPIWLAR
jgi:hypothetical protein